jgi:hypothetical protein
VNAQEQPPQRVATALTILHAPTSREEIRSTPCIHQRQTQLNTPFGTIQEEVQEGNEQEEHEAPVPGEQVPTATTEAAPSKENIPPSTGPVQPTVAMIPMIKTKRKKGKNSGAFKKSRKVLAALVNAQLQIDRQHCVHLIKKMAEPSKQFTYSAPHPKENPAPMPAITQNYDDKDTLETKLSYQDDQWEEEAAEALPRRSPRLVQHSNFVSPPPAGISQAALNAFMGNLYMQESQQSIA